MKRQSAREVIQEWQSHGDDTPRTLPVPDLNAEQRYWLRRCADGNSLRFEPATIVNPLVQGGYAMRRLAGVVITEKGLEYLRQHFE
jgi:hypothetical protein